MAMSIKKAERVVKLLGVTLFLSGSALVFNGINSFSQLYECPESLRRAPKLEQLSELYEMSNKLYEINLKLDAYSTQFGKSKLSGTEDIAKYYANIEDLLNEREIITVEADSLMKIPEVKDYHDNLKRQSVIGLYAIPLLPFGIFMYLIAKSYQKRTMLP